MTSHGDRRPPRAELARRKPASGRACQVATSDTADPHHARAPAPIAGGGSYLSATRAKRKVELTVSWQ